MTLLDWLPTTPGGVGNLLAGLALLGVGLWLLALDRRALATRYLSAFLVSYGAAVFAVAVEPPSAFADALRAAYLVPLVHSSTAFLLLAGVFPRALSPVLARASLAFAPAALAVAVLATRPLLAPPVHFAVWTGSANALAGVAVLVLALRYVRAAEGPERRSLLLLTTGGVLLVSFFATAVSVRLAVGGFEDIDSVVLAAFTIVHAGSALAALLVLARAAPRDSGARLALGAAGVSFVAGLLRALFVDVPWFDLNGWWRLAFALLVLWGILRHQFLGLDVRVRWTISRGTIAAVFVAAFFVASEGAQIVFGQENPYVGLVAAGALVFAIAPLQRAAERLAEKAVPVVGAAPSTAGGASETRYRAALRMALRDRALTREEERTLILLALDLGIRTERAYALIDEAASTAQAPREEAPA